MAYSNIQEHLSACHRRSIVVPHAAGSTAISVATHNDERLDAQ
jgi:hypothetical protein